MAENTEMISVGGQRTKLPETTCNESQKTVYCKHCSRSRIMVLTISSSILLNIVAVAIIVSTLLAQGDGEKQKPLGKTSVLTTHSKEDKQKSLRIAAFNIRKFGKSKMCNYKTSHAINTIFQRYDVILVLEVMDISQTSLENLLLILKATDESWKYVSSDRLGRRTYKEQYVFYYKSKSITVEDQYQVSDDAFDVFEREPFAIKIEYTSTSRKQLRHVALAGIHIKPSDALAELKELPAAIEDISNAFSDIDGVIVMGDYNADCSYLGKKNQQTLPIFSSNKYRNLISSAMDTTVAKGDCAYDRVTVYGEEIDTRDAKVYRFDLDMNLTMAETLAISDHYPVEFFLY